MNLLHSIQSYSTYLVSAKHREDLPVPWLADLFKRETGRNGEDLGELQQLEILVKRFKKDPRRIEVRDLGAGNGVKTLRIRNVSDIARRSSQPAKYRHLQFRLIRHLKPRVILELGTSLGFSAALFAMAAPDATVITIEGCPATAKIAKENFKRLGLGNIHLITGAFDDVLDGVFGQYPQIDYLYLDGNHRKVPTVNYFQKAIPHIHQKSTFVLDDIRWSVQMTEAWQELTRHPDVTLSVDLFAMGVLMFDKDFTKEHIQVRF